MKIAGVGPGPTPFVSNLNTYVIGYSYSEMKLPETAGETSWVGCHGLVIALKVLYTDGPMYFQFRDINLRTYSDVNRFKNLNRVYDLVFSLCEYKMQALVSRIIDPNDDTEWHISSAILNAEPGTILTLFLISIVVHSLEWENERMRERERFRLIII